MDAEKHMKYTTETCDISHLTLGMVLHYRETLNIQILYRYSADMEEHANKLYFKNTDLNFPTHVTM